MFEPHSAQINIVREEPKDLDVVVAAQKVRMRNRNITEIVYFKAKLKTRPKDAQTARAKVLKAWDNDSRLVALTPFFESWSRWRNYYHPSENDFVYSYRPTSGSPLSLAERIIHEVGEQGLDLDLVIACGHKAFQKSKIPCRLSMLASQWQEFYDRHASAVRVDLDEDEYRASSSEEWDAETL